MADQDRKQDQQQWNQNDPNKKQQGQYDQSQKNPGGEHKGPQTDQNQDRTRKQA